MKNIVDIFFVKQFLCIILYKKKQKTFQKYQIVHTKIVFGRKSNRIIANALHSDGQKQKLYIKKLAKKTVNKKKNKKYNLLLLCFKKSVGFLFKLRHHFTQQMQTTITLFFTP